MAWVALLVPCLAGLYWRPKFAPLFAFTLGFLWAAGLAHLRMADWLAPELEGRDLDVVGVVSSLPAVGARAVRFEFEVESQGGGARLPKKLLLSWHRSSVRRGRRGTARAGRASRRALAVHRAAAPPARPRQSRTASITKPGCSSAASARPDTSGRRASAGASAPGMAFSIMSKEPAKRCAIAFRPTLGATPAAGILAALAVGDQRAISAEEWRLFNRTGVTHLMSISGLHVTLVSGLAAWLVAFGWRRVPAAALRLPARKAAAAGRDRRGARLHAARRLRRAGAAHVLHGERWSRAALWCGRIASPSRTLALALVVIVAADPGRRSRRACGSRSAQWR